MTKETDYLVPAPLSEDKKLSMPELCVTSGEIVVGKNRTMCLRVNHTSLSYAEKRWVSEVLGFPTKKDYLDYAQLTERQMNLFKSIFVSKI